MRGDVEPVILATGQCRRLLYPELNRRITQGLWQYGILFLYHPLVDKPAQDRDIPSKLGIDGEANPRADSHLPNLAGLDELAGS